MDPEQIVPRRVCVGGASGRIGSSLVRKLLQRGHVVHATIRNLCDEEKTGLLRSLPGADTRLRLFEADLFHPHQFQQAIHGCEFVFLVAFPTNAGPKSEEAGEAVLASLQTILSACERSGTVRRLIYTGSITTASPLGEEKDLPCSKHCLIDESCWTSPHAPVLYPGDAVKFYVSIKTASEKQLMSYGDQLEGENSVEVVVLTCGVVGGDALVDSTAGVGAVLSPLIGDRTMYENFKLIQKMLCSVPLVHLDDVCEAHLFCMDVPLSSRSGRFLCASAYPSLWEIFAYYRLNYSDLLVLKEEPEDCGNPGLVAGGSTKLRDMGFEYKYGMEQIIDDSVRFAKRFGLLKGCLASNHQVDNM